MASYVALVSLKQTINDVVTSHHPLDKRDCSNRSLDDLEGQIRDFARELEDALELHEPDQLEEEITSFVEFATNMEISCKDLEVLKLKNYAFRGPKWEVQYKVIFPKLKFLLMEGSDLAEWKVTFGIMECLCIQTTTVGFFKNIEIVDCNPLCMNWALKMGQKTSNCQANVHASWIAATY